MKGDALRDHALDVGGARGGNQVARALDAQPRIARKAFLVLRRAGRESEIGELMNDRLRRRRLDRARKGLGVEHVDHHRLGAERAQRVGLFGRARGADHRMAGGTQQRRQPAPDRPARSGQKDFHEIRTTTPRP